MVGEVIEQAGNIRKLKYTSEDITKLYKAGILCENDRIELIDGEIFYMSPINFPHAQCVRRLNYLLNNLLPNGYFVDTQNPIKLNKQSILQPDVVVYPKDIFLKLADHPTADIVQLLIEVADSSYQGDRHIKLPKYAEADIVEVWIVNLQAKSVEVFTQPREKQYLSLQTYLSDQSVPTPFQFSIPVLDIVGT